MDYLYIFVFIIILGVTVFLPLYLLGRLLFASTPFMINFYFEEKANWYNDWNKQRFLIVLILFLASLALSIFVGRGILIEIQSEKIDFTQILFYVLLHILAMILFEVKMEHPFKPIRAFKKFKEKSYNERFEIQEKQNTDEIIKSNFKEIKEEISKGNQIISKGFQQQEQTLSETNELTKLNNKILQESEFAFEIKNNPNLAIADIMQDYFISKDSEKTLSDFLLRKKKSGKILFTKPARNGVSVQPVLDFFSTFTNVISNCRLNITTQAETAKIINTISSAKNLSKYLSGGDFRAEI